MRTVDPVKQEEKRREILDAVKRCFVRDGLRAASISSICAEAGISPGHLYYYFESKEAILGAIAQMILERITEQFSRTMESSDALAALISDQQRAKALDPENEHILVLDMLAEAVRNPALAKILEEQSKQMHHLLTDFLRKGQARGRIDPDLDAETAAAVIMSVVDGSKMIAVRDPSINRLKVIELLHTLIVRFLTPPGQPTADAPLGRSQSEILQAEVEQV